MRKKRAQRRAYVDSEPSYRNYVVTLCCIFNQLAMLYHSGTEDEDDTLDTPPTRWGNPVLSLSSYEGGVLQKTLDARTRYDKTRGGHVRVHIKDADGLVLKKFIVAEKTVKMTQVLLNLFRQHFAKTPYFDGGSTIVSNVDATNLYQVLEIADKTMKTRLGHDPNYLWYDGTPDEDNVRTVGFVTRDTDADGNKLPFQGMELRLNGRCIDFDRHSPYTLLTWAGQIELPNVKWHILEGMRKLRPVGRKSRVNTC